MNKERLTLPNGGEGIPAVLWGEPGGRCLIAVHGNRSHKEDTVIELLARHALPRGYRVLSFDLPRHGERETGAQPLDPPNCVGDLNAVYGYAERLSPEPGLFACSLGAYFSLLAYHGRRLRQSLFLSPVVDMERVIENLMDAFGVTEQRLREERRIALPVGETLDWDYYGYVRSHPVRFPWESPTDILRGSEDDLSERDRVLDFAARYGARVRTLEGGGHFFHTQEQLGCYEAWLEETLR